LGLRRRRHFTALGCGALRTFATARLAAAATGTAAFATAAEHLHLVGHDVGGVVLDAFLLVGAVLDPALDVDLATLAQVFARDLAELAEQLDPVPLGLFLLVAVAVLADRRRRNRKRADRHAALGILHVGVVAEIADQDHFVDAAGHGLSFRYRPGVGMGTVE